MAKMIASMIPGPGNQAHAAMLLYAFLISTSFPIGKAITNQIDPVVVTFLRFGLASIVFFALLVASEKLVIPKPKDFLRYAVISLSMLVFFIFMFEALKLTTTVKTGAIFTLLPLTSGLIGYIAMRIKMTLMQVVALVIGSMGATWVLFDGSLTALIAFDLGRGELLFALGTLSFATYAPLVKKLHRGESILAMTFWVLVSGTVILGVFGATLISATQWETVSSPAYMGVVYLALFNTAGTFFLSKYASLQLPPAKVMAYTYLTPGFVVMFAAIESGPPTLSVLAGIGVTMLAMILLHRTG